MAAPSSPQPGLLPSAQCAPGYQGYMRDSSRHNSSSGSSSSGNNLSNVHSLYNISEWVPVTEGLQARHYRSVAKRRATEVPSNFPLLVPTVSEPPVSGMGTSSRYLYGGGAGSNDVISPAPQRPSASPYGRRGSQGNINSYSSSTPTLHEDVARPRETNNTQQETALNASAETLPVSPHEDPDLVGEAAAAEFRSQRLYMTAQQQRSQYISAATSHPTPYRSLIAPEAGTPTPTQSTEQVNRSNSLPSPHTQADPPRPAGPSGTHERHRSATTTSKEEALRDQESKAWDHMLSQMADWEERERSWKQFKVEANRRVGAGVFWGQGLRLGLGGKGKLRKIQSENSGGGERRSKWMLRLVSLRSVRTCEGGRN